MSFFALIYFDKIICKLCWYQTNLEILLGFKIRLDW